MAARRASQRPSFSKYLCLLSLALAVVLHAPRARAIVNTEPLFKDIKDRPYGALLKGDIDTQRGNTMQLNFNLSLAARARYREHEFLLSGAHSRSAANRELTGNNSFAHLRYRYWTSQWVQWEFFGQIAQNRFQLISLREVGGSGPRFVPLHIKYFQWALSFAYMYEVEHVDGSVDFPDGLVRKNHRANLSSVARLDYKKLTLRQTIFLQPAFIDPTNIRILHQLDFAVEVFKHFSLTWTATQTRDSIAPSDVLPYDNRLTGGFKLDF